MTQRIILDATDFDDIDEDLYFMLVEAFRAKAERMGLNLDQKILDYWEVSCKVSDF